MNGKHSDSPVHPSEKKRLSRKAAFLKWVSEKSGFGHYSELMVQQSMEDSDTYVGVAWTAWKAAWRLKP